MLKNIFIVLLVLTSIIISQETKTKIINGKVEYVSSQFIYINFENTEGINVGDTLFTSFKKSYIPQLIVKSKSSRSCAAISIKNKYKKGDEIIAIAKIRNKEEQKEEENQNNVILSNEPDEVKIKSTKIKRIKAKERKFYGRLSLSGYSSISNESDFQNYQKWRYSLSLNADNIKGSGFSISNYMIFRYRADDWNYTSNHLGNSYKIYDLAVSYDHEKTTFRLGRKINNKIANIGAIDGLQAETRYNSFLIGGVIGSRPDFNDYGYNINLFQVGGFINRTDSIGSGIMENTLSLFQQMNHGSTDRRFLYLQHSNSIVKNLSMFISSEVDLFKKQNNKSSNDFRLTSLYFSLRYSPLRWLSTSASYDARKNVIYYETFKNYADQLLESATRQGFRLRINIRPINYVFVSLNSGYRFSQSDVKSTNNYGISVTHSKIPYLNLSANVNYLGLHTSYIDGNILGFRLSKDLFNGLAYTTFEYRNVNYSFMNTDRKLLQNIFQLDLSFRINRGIGFSLSFEGTYEGKTSYSNIYTNFSWRF